MLKRCLVMAFLPGLLVAAGFVFGAEQGGLVRPETLGLRANDHFIAPPGPGEDWHEWLAKLRSYRRQVRQAGFDDSIYRREDLKWMTHNFVCGFIFMYDRAFWDPQRRQYRAEQLCHDARREFGGYDSVVLWHDYPRIGADRRNQFDFFRQMPGGLQGLRGVVREFHRQRVKVFIPYMPWDVGTRREKDSDERALSQIVAAIEADGVFLDTMQQSPEQLRETIDVLRPGVAFEPELPPSIQEIQRCSGSWGQWLRPFPDIGVLHLKWVEPRHMQHQIRRWDKSHRDELAAAWLSGSGMLVWENIFGSMNPWNAEDRATLRRMATVWRHFAQLLAEGEWLPCFPTLRERVVASGWQGEGVRLWTMVNLSGQPVDAAILELEAREPGEQFFDLWRGVPVRPERRNGKVRLTMPIESFGAVLALRSDDSAASLARLLEGQQRESRRVVPEPREDSHVVARSVVEPKAPPICAAARATATAGMLPVEGGTKEFVVRHMRRECGCYPDPGTPSERWAEFLAGTPHAETIEHHVTATVHACSIDPKVVTNGQFEAFLQATDYRPWCPDRFVDHWGGKTCPTELKDQPVVYVDVDDARAYAAWAGRRLPTEWEWHLAAQQHGEAFRHSEVHEWTESERDDGHTRFVILRGGCRYQAKGSIWYFPGGPQPIDAHAKFLLLYPGLDRCSTIGFRCVAPE